MSLAYWIFRSIHGTAFHQFTLTQCGEHKLETIYTFFDDDAEYVQYCRFTRNKLRALMINPTSEIAAAYNIGYACGSDLVVDKETIVAFLEKYIEFNSNNMHVTSNSVKWNYLSVFKYHLTCTLYCTHLTQ